MAKSKKLIITAAMVGNATSREQTPYVPITPDEIAADAVACVKAGASVLHIHVRDKDGINTMDPEVWKEVITKVRAALKAEGLDAILNPTTSGSKFPDEMRIHHLDFIKPEMCSFDPGSMNWANSFVFLNTPTFLEKLGKHIQEIDVKPEIEIFDGGHIQNVYYYIKKGILKTPCHIQFVLGVTGALPGDAESLAYLLPKIPEGSTWSITGIGKAHIPCMLLGLAAGCDGLRVGLEDNLYLDKGVLATNAQLVERAVKLAKLCNREIATAEEAREILGVKKKVD